ncbi:hypothetical protein [Moraxella oblonga]|uniref:hypothetical protein n=1 Tax=Moraxella oblonga TaxID=200413 RepID=UPI00082ACF95|nr:hypothetical protein [Moraxella oblonga]
MFFFLIMMAIAFGLALPFTAYWLYDAMREKSVKRRVLMGLTFMMNLVGFLYLAVFLWAVMHISV